MKKVLTALLLISLLFALCACGGTGGHVSAESFMSRAKVNSLVKRYGEKPQAELTLSYTSSGDEVVVKVVYDLLLEQAPLAVTRFIQIANEGGYEGTLADTLNKDHDYIVMGRYKKFDDDNYYYDVRGGQTTFAGEFKQNDYKQPKGGYATFGMFSLAMYHANDGAQFDAANGTLILSLTSDEKKVLNSANYAVFAQLASISVKVGKGELVDYRKVPSFVRENLYGFSARVTRKVYDRYDDTKGYVSVQMMSTAVKLHVEMLGNHDWSKLPKIG